MQHNRFKGSRENVLEAIEIMGSTGATYDELFKNLYADADSAKAGRQSLSRVLGFALNDDSIVEYKNRYYLAEFAPREANGRSPIAAQAMNVNGTLSAHAKKREGIVVEVYTSPQVYDEVLQVMVCFNGGQWFKLPLSGSIRVCLGPEIPVWSTNQEANSGISGIKIYLKDKAVQEIVTNPQHWITIDRAG